MVGQQLENLQAVALIAALRDLYAEHGLLVAVVLLGIEEVFAGSVAGPARRHQRPAGEGPRDVLDIGIGVAAIDAERVQLHDLARVVFVRLALDADPVVQVLEHGGTLGAGGEHVAELAERIGADHLAVVHRLHPLVGILADVDVEVVRPEVHHQLVELPLAVCGAQQRCLLQLVDNILRPLGAHSLRYFGGLWRGGRAGNDCRLCLGLRLRVASNQLGETHLERGKLLQQSVQRAVVDGLGMELLLDIKVEPHLRHAVDVVRPQAKCHAHERQRHGRWRLQVGCRRGCPGDRTRGDRVRAAGSRVRGSSRCAGRSRLFVEAVHPVGSAAGDDGRRAGGSGSYKKLSAGKGHLDLQS